MSNLSPDTLRGMLRQMQTIRRFEERASDGVRAGEGPTPIEAKTDRQRGERNCDLAIEDPDTFPALKAPVKRICALNVPIPYAPPLEGYVFPDRHRIADGVRELVGRGKRGAAA